MQEELKGLHSVKSPIIEKLFRALNENKMNILNDLFAEDATMIINTSCPKPYAGIFKGRAEIIEGFVRRSMSLINESAAFKVNNFFVNGSRIAIELHNIKSEFITSQYNPRNCSVLIELLHNKIHVLSVYMET